MKIMLVQALFAEILILFYALLIVVILKSECVKKMKEFGDGAKMEILADWGNNKSHVFIAEQIYGKTLFFDSQNRRKDCDDYFNNAKHILAVRIDNALFSDNLKNFVVSME